MGLLTPRDNTGRRRMSARTEAGWASESRILRRVASFSLDQASKEPNCQSVRLQYHRLDGKLFERFEGQYLVNWAISGLSKHLKSQMSNVDLKAIGAAFCSHLLSAGILRKFSDKNGGSPTHDTSFQMNNIYYWMPKDVSSVLPEKPLEELTDSSEKLYNLQEQNAKLYEEILRLKGLLRQHEERKESKSTQTTPENEIRISKNADASSPMPKNPKMQDHTLEGSSDSSGRFTASTLDISPILSDKTRSFTSTEELKSDVLRSVKTNIKLDNSLIIDTVHDISKVNHDRKDTNIKTSNKIIDLTLDREMQSTQECLLDKNKESIPALFPKIASTTPPYIPMISDIEIPSLLPSSSVSETTCSPPPTSSSPPSPPILRVAGPPPPPALMMPNMAEPPPPPPIPDIAGSPPVPGVTELPPLLRMQGTAGPPPMPKIAGPPLPPPIPEMAKPPIPPTIPEIAASTPPSPTPRMIEPPPPTPMPGMTGPPPPPPMPGMTGPPPPPPMPGVTGPPPPPPLPPPIPEMAKPPIPPPIPGIAGPPPIPKMTGPPPPPPMPVVAGPPPPPPMPEIAGPPPPPIPGASAPPPIPSGSQITGYPSSSQFTGPASLPPPPPGGWNPPARALMRKQAVNPEVPMKPLFWTRILVPAEPVKSNADTAAKNSLWLELEEEKNLNIKEFAELFSRQANERKPALKANVSKSSKIGPAKILDCKRSKTVGILEKSLHVDFVEIENAVYNLDTSIVGLEALQQIYEIRPTSKELEDISAHERECPDVPLDSPELFLKKLSGIQFFSERISCLMFQAEFADAIASVSSKLANLRSVCEFMLKSSSLKRVMALILTLGNYMNGGNRMRGQADGFGLEILGKLKDVKSKIPGVTLLHYIVKARLAQEGDHNSSESLPLPVPEPADVLAASLVNFEDVTKELDYLEKRVQDCVTKCKTVVEGSPEIAGPFKFKMDAFLERAHKELADEVYAFQEAKAKFKKVMIFYQYVPKGSTLDTAEPKDFFLLWISFCQDFKDIWKKEQQMLKKIEDIREKYKAQRKIETTKKKEGGLKARLQKLTSKR